MIPLLSQHELSKPYRFIYVIAVCFRSKKKTSHYIIISSMQYNYYYYRIRRMRKYQLHSFAYLAKVPTSAHIMLWNFIRCPLRSSNIFCAIFRFRYNESNENQRSAKNWCHMLLFEACCGSYEVTCTIMNIFFVLLLRCADISSNPQFFLPY